MIARFQGSEGPRRLRDALCQQEAIAGDVSTAAALAKAIVLRQLEARECLIEQDAPDNDIYFILSGTVAVTVNGREVAQRHAGQHVGEMALIDLGAPRSAGVVALERTVVARASEPDFVKVATAAPHLWRNLARQLCVRLRQRGVTIRPPNPVPVLFLGSSKESLYIAREVQLGLNHDNVVVTVWTDHVFGASHFPIDDLAAQILKADFAALVLGPDDRVISRTRESDAPRDNVVFELGLFMGALSRERTFMITPRGADLKIPSDLLGLTPLEFAVDPKGHLAERLGPACEDLRRSIARQGAR
jgi:predicted nucleotide-binding protein